MLISLLHYSLKGIQGHTLAVLCTCLVHLSVSHWQCIQQTQEMCTLLLTIPQKQHSDEENAVGFLNKIIKVTQMHTTISAIEANLIHDLALRCNEMHDLMYLNY